MKSSSLILFAAFPLLLIAQNDYSSLQAQLSAVLNSQNLLHVMRNCIPSVVLVGNPNSGKSTLVQRILRIPMITGNSEHTNTATEIISQFDLSVPRDQTLLDISISYDNENSRTCSDFKKSEMVETSIPGNRDNVERFKDATRRAASRLHEVLGIADDANQNVPAGNHIKISVRRPAKIAMSFVDMPGTYGHGISQDVIDQYLSTEAAIPLAVYDCSSDLEVQSAGKVIRQTAAEKNRFNILTHPDKCPGGAIANEEVDQEKVKQMWELVCRNSNSRLHAPNKWWVLMSKKNAEQNLQRIDIDRVEEAFFHTNPFWRKVLDHDRLMNGGTTLCEKQLGIANFKLALLTSVNANHRFDIALEKLTRIRRSCFANHSMLEQDLRDKQAEPSAVFQDLKRDLEKHFKSTSPLPLAKNDENFEKAFKTLAKGLMSYIPFHDMTNGGYDEFKQETKEAFRSSFESVSQKQQIITLMPHAVEKLIEKNRHEKMSDIQSVVKKYEKSIIRWAVNFATDFALKNPFVLQNEHLRNAFTKAVISVSSDLGVVLRRRIDQLLNMFKVSDHFSVNLAYYKQLKIYHFNELVTHVFKNEGNQAFALSMVPHLSERGYMESTLGLLYPRRETITMIHSSSPGLPFDNTHSKPEQYLIKTRLIPDGFAISEELRANNFAENYKKASENNLSVGWFTPIWSKLFRKNDKELREWTAKVLSDECVRSECRMSQRVAPADRLEIYYMMAMADARALSELAVYAYLDNVWSATHELYLSKFMTRVGENLQNELVGRPLIVLEEAQNSRERYNSLGSMPHALDEAIQIASRLIQEK